MDVCACAAAIEGTAATGDVFDLWMRRVARKNLWSRNQELADSLHVDLDWLAGCTDLLRDRPQLIFYGPPGTGKTYIAKDVGSASRRPGHL